MKSDLEKNQSLTIVYVNNWCFYGLIAMKSGEGNQTLTIVYVSYWCSY